MAKICCCYCWFNGTPLQLRRNHSVEYKNCSNSKRKSFAIFNRGKGEQTETPQVLKTVVSGVTELLRLFSPSPQTSTLSSDIDDDQFPVSSIDDVLIIIKSDYDNAYFVTGNFTSSIYAEDCSFEDPTIQFRGLLELKEEEEKTYHLPISSSYDACVVTQDVDSDTNYLRASWKLRTNLKLPWRPLIAIDGRTFYELNEDFKIVRHVESWNVSALEAILQIFTFKFRKSGG